MNCCHVKQNGPQHFDTREFTMVTKKICSSGLLTSLLHHKLSFFITQLISAIQLESRTPNVTIWTTAYAMTLDLLKCINFNLNQRVMWIHFTVRSKLYRMKWNVISLKISGGITLHPANHNHNQRSRSTLKAH